MGGSMGIVYVGVGWWSRISKKTQTHFNSARARERERETGEVYYERRANFSFSLSFLLQRRKMESVIASILGTLAGVALQLRFESCRVFSVFFLLYFSPYELTDTSGLPFLGQE
jgi:hypothetical protein